MTIEDFSQQVKDALNHLYDYPYLESHPLASGVLDLTFGGPNRAQRLSRLLLETIEALYPPAQSTRDTSKSRCYSLLVYRYIEEWPLEKIMEEFGYSRRQFFREQRKAVEILAAALQEKIPVLSNDTPKPATLDDEVDRFLTHNRAINIQEIVQGTLSLVNNLAQNHNVSISCWYEPDLPLAFGSRTLLRQVFLNSFSTLITQCKAAEIALAVQETQHSLHAILTAKLTIPLPVEARPNFESARHFLTKLNGRWLEPDISSAKIICEFTLPISTEQVILVIEDNESVIKAFQRYLNGYNYRVVGVTDATQALEIARSLLPAMITLDIMMPNQDGWETLQMLKNNPETNEIPVVICSVLQDPDLAMSLGAAGFLNKPVAQTELLATLDQLLRMK